MPTSMTMTTYRTRPAKHPASYLLLAIFLICLSACSAKRIPVHVDFEASWAGQALRCEGADMALTDLRFFVSNVILLDANGVQHNVTLTPDERWQQDGVALIDLESGNKACSNGTADMNPSIKGTVVAGEFVALKFSVGVPFELNHANPLLAQPPLDRAAMHWHWRSGYKFLRAGVSNATDGFWIHLGSTGCEGTIQNITGCHFPNRVSVELPGFSADTNTITVDLAELFTGVDLDDGVRDDCSSSPAESTCARPFESLGLAFKGETHQRAQRVFQRRH